MLQQTLVRTLASELVRQTLIYCANKLQTTACALPSTGAKQCRHRGEYSVPFLLTSGFTATPSASRSAINATTGVMGITASVSYNFSFMLPVWKGTINQVAQTANLGY